METIWKDKTSKTLTYYFMAVPGFGVGAVLLITETAFPQIAFGVFMILLGTIFLSSAVWKRHTVVTKEQLILGNFVRQMFPKPGLRFEWTEIISLKIQRHPVSSGRGSYLQDFLFVQTRNKKQYSTTLFDRAGFLKALKTIHKNGLLKGTEDLYEQELELM